MAGATLRHEVDEILQHLPETATLNDFLYALQMHADIAEGMRDSDAGRVTSNANVRKMFELPE